MCCAFHKVATVPLSCNLVDATAVDSRFSKQRSFNVVNILYKLLYLNI